MRAALILMAIHIQQRADDRGDLLRPERLVGDRGRHLLIYTGVSRELGAEGVPFFADGGVRHSVASYRLEP